MPPFLRDSSCTNENLLVALATARMRNTAYMGMTRVWAFYLQIKKMDIFNTEILTACNPGLLSIDS